MNQTVEAYENYEDMAVAAGLRLADLPLGKEHQYASAADLSSRYLQSDFWVGNLHHRVLEYKRSRYIIKKLNANCKEHYQL